MLSELSNDNPSIVVLDDEYTDLSDIICSAARTTAGLSLLWRELGRATLSPRTRAPADLVRMGSRVHFTDLDRRESRMVHLVYPEEASTPVFVPVTSSIGAALLGLRPGDVFSWVDPAGEVRTLRIDRVEPPLRPQVRKRRA
ncbi:GreA/GreB family elongation factor [Phenylobacterium sp. LjRoot219]|uniref:GreA/GreB family elongation factor n=1 Tax=Phenylobacterium sp. LjRoot219 TaxID=3342283 RepID=UPI003F4F8212